MLQNNTTKNVETKISSIEELQIEDLIEILNWEEIFGKTKHFDSIKKFLSFETKDYNSQVDYFTGDNKPVKNSLTRKCVPSKYIASTYSKNEPAKKLFQRFNFPVSENRIHLATSSTNPKFIEKDSVSSQPNS